MEKVKYGASVGISNPGVDREEFLLAKFAEFGLKAVYETYVHDFDKDYYMSSGVSFEVWCDAVCKTVPEWISKDDFIAVYVDRLLADYRTRGDGEEAAIV